MTIEQINSKTKYQILNMSWDIKSSLMNSLNRELNYISYRLIARRVGIKVERIVKNNLQRVIYL